MLCIKDIILYSLIFPMPAASPFFLIIFTLALFFALRPCAYCLVLFSILFLSTSPNSPFLNTYPNTYPTSPSNSSPPTFSAPHHFTSLTETRHLTSPGALSALPLSSPVPYRAWFDFNAGRVWEPRLVGYREMGEALGYERDRKVQERKAKEVVAVLEAKQADLEREKRERADGEERVEGEERSAGFGSVGDRLSGFWGSFVGRRGLKVTPEATPHPDPAAGDTAPPPPLGPATPATPVATTRETKPLPPGYIDLRFRGVGFVLDLGWRRTDEGIQWEIEEALGREWDRSELVVEREKRVKARMARVEAKRMKREMRRAEREKKEKERKEKDGEEEKAEEEKEKKEKGRAYKVTMDRSEGGSKVEVEKSEGGSKVEEEKIEKKGLWRRALGKMSLVGSW